MKRKTKLLVLIIIIFTITGCSNNGSSHSSAGSGNSVDEVINGQLDIADASSSDAETDISDLEERRSADDLPEISEETDSQAADGVDYDLTAMSSDMVYAMVFQMMTDPDTYVGKTFRMDGIYYSVYSELTAQSYHYCIIQDALACCAQGMEFVCGDGLRLSPEDYPEENAEIVVQGIFETYEEEGDSSLFCRLKDAELLYE